VRKAPVFAKGFARQKKIRRIYLQERIEKHYPCGCKPPQGYNFKCKIKGKKEEREITIQKMS